MGGQLVRFVVGFASGFLALPMAGALALALLILAEQGDRDPAEIPASFWTVGHKVTQAGGVSVRVERGAAEVTRQACREACDDLIYWIEAAERVEVRDGAGDCLLCEGQGLRLPFTSPKRWRLTGYPLRLEEEHRR